MKNLYFLASLLAFPVILLAQNIHGIWSGTLRNDSTQRIQNFELGLSEYRGKITGYTYTTFIENDTFYYSVKRIKAERKDGKLIVEDVEMIGNNFPQKAAKHVKQITTFPLINDTTIDIANGRWSTNQTKKYYSLYGSATIKEQEEEKESELLAHLQEMKVKNDIAVSKKEKKEEKSAVKNSPTLKPDPAKNDKIQEKKNDIAKNSSTVNPVTDSNKGQVSQAKQTEVAKVSQDANVKVISDVNGGQKPDDRNIFTNYDNRDNQLTQNTKQEIAISNKPTVPQSVPVSTPKNTATANPAASQAKVSEQKQIIQPTASKTTQPSNENVGDEKKVMNTVAINAPAAQKKEAIATVKELPSIVSQRKNETIQELYFKNDSLVLSLYDNGIIDGDTVSVFVNGENIISKQKLKEAATKKTIYISPRADSVQLVLFAENLGTIPPNTGLLTVRDGDEVYQVRFSADLQKNASIFLRRKKDQ
jgi:hypothetical protein